MDLGASPEAEGWKDVLQLLREQNEKMEKLARALSVIQRGMLRNNPGVEFQKRLESHPASKRIGIFRRPRSASLGDNPKKLPKGEKRVAPSPPEDRTSKTGKGSSSPTHAAATRCQTPQKDGERQLVEKKKERKVPAFCTGI